MDSGDLAQFDAERRRAIERFGLISSRSAGGFRIDLHHALEDVAGLQRVRIKKTGEADCGLVAAALYRGRADQAMREIAQALESECSYGEASAVAFSANDDVIEVRFLTYAESFGTVTVCLEAMPIS